MEVRTEITDPAYWRQRAQEARRMAEQLSDPVVQRTMRDRSDPVSQQTMRDIAAAYEQLAEIAQARRAAEKTD